LIKEYFLPSTKVKIIFSNGKSIDFVSHLCPNDGCNIRFCLCRVQPAVSGLVYWVYQQR